MQHHALAIRETDVDGAIRRPGSDEEIYVACLHEYLQGNTVAELNTAIVCRVWDDAFVPGRALKGGAGNVGSAPLMHAAGTLLLLIRGELTRRSVSRS